VDTGIEGNIAIGFALVQGDVVFTDEQHGWAVGGLGQVVHTEDGGSTWVKQELTCDWPECPKRLFAVDFVDNQVGWIVGEGLFHTMDGGAHWAQETIDFDSDFQDVQFLNADIGWLAGDRDGLIYTTDGGSQWHRLESSTSVPLRGLYFVNPKQGWIVGDYGTILGYSSSD